MTSGTTIAASATTASRALKTAEWVAENAYIAPGFHRLLTAGGLTAGLWAGRGLMDVVTARDASRNEETSEGQVTEILRPLHGIMRYNPYSDAAADRWKFVIDRMAPIAFGAVAAYGGGKWFFHGNMPTGEAFSATSAAAHKAWELKQFSTEALDVLLRVKHSDATRKWAAATFVEGSAAGMHLPGALWPFNNGMIAVSFQQGAGRNISLPFMARINRWLGNHGGSSRYLYSAMRDTTSWMSANVAKFAHAEEWAHPEELLRRAKDGLQKFPHRSAADEQKLVNAFTQLIEDAYHHKATQPQLTEAMLRHNLYDFCSGRTNPTRGLQGASYDHFLRNIGFDLTKQNLARDPWAFFSRLFGARAHEHKATTQYARYLQETHCYQFDTEAWVNQQLHAEPWKVAAAYGAGAATIGGALVGAGIAHSRLHKESNHRHKPHIHLPHFGKQRPPHAASTDPSTTVPPSPEATSPAKNFVDWVNDKPLRVAHWVSRVVITPPSMHRFMNAAYLSLVLYGGMRFSNILTGRKLTKLMSNKLIEGIPESVVLRKDVWAPLRPLHGLLAYTPSSAAIADRWRQALHFILPVGLGMFGTYTGSYLYFRDRQKSLAAPNTLEDYADRIAFEQSKFYAGATALTSIFNTGSGIHLLPIFNYSSNLHNRYLLGSGQQVALPGLGRWWSGNAGTTPWGVKASLSFMTRYLTHNPAPRPEEMPALVHSVLGKLYPDLDEDALLQKKQIILDRIYDVRDSYFADAALPASKREALGEAMGKLLSGAGFEALLQEAELDPAKANLASNGASGSIANACGKRGVVARLTQEYQEKLAARRAAGNVPASADFLRSLVDKHEASHETSFSARVKSTQKSETALAA